MDIKEFIDSTVMNLDATNLEQLKEKLIGEYLRFSFIDENEVPSEAFCEKLADHFEKTEIKTGDDFAKILAKYVANIDEVVKRYVPKEPSAKKGEPTPPMPRSLKYYKLAMDIKSSRNLTIKQLADYSRIMMSLYMGAINADMKTVDKYEFPTNKLDLGKIISALKAEKPVIGLNVGKLAIGKKVMFNLEDLYCADTATFVITMIMFCYIKNNEMEGEN